jgi:hypothetical protein
MIVYRKAQRPSMVVLLSPVISASSQSVREILQIEQLHGWQQQRSDHDLERPHYVRRGTRAGIGFIRQANVHDRDGHSLQQAGGSSTCVADIFGAGLAGEYDAPVPGLFSRKLQ